MSDSTSHTTTEYTSSPSNKSKREASSRNKLRKSPKREGSGRRFRKSKTPPSRKSSSFSPSSSDGESSEDDFPRYRSNWMEKSPSNSSNRSRRLYDDLKDLDDLLSDARDVIRTILQK